MELTSFYRSKPITPADAAGRIASGATRSKDMTIKFAGQDEEAALVLAAKSGDGRAFEILIERHRQRILAVVRRFTHIREDAEDIVQQSLQKAFFHLHRFQGKSRFSTWLTRIAINEALMFLRRGRRLREVSIDDLCGNEAIELRDLGELSMEEAARVMGLSVAAVKGRVFHGRKKLHQVLKRESVWIHGKQVLGAGRKVNGFSRRQLACGSCD